MPDQDLGSFIDLFFSTANDHYASIKEQILRISEKEDNTSVLYEIYRRSHSLKGSSMMMGYKNITEVCVSLVSLVHPENGQVFQLDQLSQLNILTEKLYEQIQIAKTR